MVKIFLPLLFLSNLSLIFAQDRDVKLQKKIDAIVAGFKGDVGLYIKNIGTGKVVTINADSLFPTASMVKIPILIGVMDKIQKSELNFHQELIYHDSILYPGVDILGSFKNGEKIELSKIIMLMLTMSDNTASLWLQKLAGTGSRINEILDGYGFVKTKVNSKTPGREILREKYGWGQTTPKEMATILEKIYKGQVITPEASARMLRILNRNYWDDQAAFGIPPYATIFSKNGALDEYRAEVMLVRGVKSTYTFCMILNNNADTSWTPHNEKSVLIRKISNFLWNYYEPSHQWNPPAEALKLY